MYRFGLLGFANAGDVYARSAEIVGRDIFEDCRLPRQQIELGYRQGQPGALGRGHPELDDAFGMGVWERFEESSVDEREDGGVGADSERQSGDSGDGEATTAPQRAGREACFLEQYFGRSHRRVLTRLFSQTLTLRSDPGLHA